MPTELVQEQGGFRRELLALALPIALQHLIIFGLGMVDMVMIGQLGAGAVAAVAIGNQLQFLFILYLFGVSSGIGVFAAQYYGAGDLPMVRRLAGLTWLAALGGAVPFFLAARLATTAVTGIWSEDPAVLPLAGDYLRITAWSYLPMALVISTSNTLKAMRSVTLPLVATAIALLLNTGLNWLLIFGHLGFPALGVQGAAIATLIARCVDAALLLGVVFGRGLELAGPLHQFAGWSRELVRRVTLTALPVVTNEAGWGLGTAMFSVIYGRMGTEALAAWGISEMPINCAMVFIFGTCHACNVMTGNRAGSGDRDAARRTARRFIRLALAGGVFFSMLSLLASPFVPRLYAVPARVAEDSRLILVVFAAVLTFKSLNFHLIVGILRGGGDTRFGMLVDLGGLWLVGVPLAALGGLYWGLAVHLVYALASVEEFVKFFFALARYRSGRWLNVLTEQPGTTG